MIPITKAQEPDDLRIVREFANREGYKPKDAYGCLKNPEKRTVIEALKREQGHLCVYCMCRIPREDAEHEYSAVSIEHVIPLELPDNKDLGQALNYSNMFAVCHGYTSTRRKGSGRLKGKSFLTCDKHKGNILLKKVDPLNADTLKSIFYHVDGRIDAEDEDVKFDLVETLNLNGIATPLVGERKAALDELISYIGTYDTGDLKGACEKAMYAYKAETDPKTPYVGILIWYLKSLLEGLEQLHYE